MSWISDRLARGVRKIFETIGDSPSSEAANREETEFLGELEALEVCDRQYLVSLYLNSSSMHYLRGIHSPLSIPAHA